MVDLLTVRIAGLSWLGVVEGRGGTRRGSALEGVGGEGDEGGGRFAARPYLSLDTSLGQRQRNSKYV